MASWRRRRDDDEFPGYVVAAALPPGFDGLHIASPDPRAYGGAESRPGQRHGTSDERRIACLVGVGIGERRRNAATINDFESGVRTSARQRVLLPG